MERIVKYRHNIMCVNSISSFANVKGGYNQDCRDVYFIRALGINQDLTGDICKMDEQLGNSMIAGKLLYKRVGRLSFRPSPEEADYYSSCYEKWLGSRQSTIETKLKDAENVMPVLNEALRTVLSRYEAGKPGLSESIKKNFIVKVLYWFDAVMEGFLDSWNERLCIKIVADNITKEQEYLFFYLLTLVGCDVLLIQSGADVEAGEEIKGLSKELVLGSYGECQLPTYMKKESKHTDSKAAGAVHGQADGGKIKIQMPKRHREHQHTVTEAPAAFIPKTVPAVTGRAENNTKTRTEKSFEELAMLASSVVMIAIHDNTGEVIGIGSGIMIGRKGYILTNNHVAAGGRYYSVRIENDEKVYRTNELIKYNYTLDLAVLRIDRQLNPIPLYRGSQKLVRGQKVVAIGSPLGFFNSVSDGIISGFRNIDGVDMIQFTAPISHGSSGGAVLNMFGEVIGISTAGYDDGQNINVAVGYESINMFSQGFV